MTSEEFKKVKKGDHLEFTADCYSFMTKGRIYVVEGIDSGIEVIDDDGQQLNWVFNPDDYHKYWKKAEYTKTPLWKKLNGRN